MTRSEIIDRANQAFNAAIQRGQSCHAEILWEREASLSSVPSGKEAMAAHAASFAKANADLTVARQAIQATLESAEAAAESAQPMAAALDAWRNSDQESWAALNKETRAAREAYDEEYKRLMRLQWSPEWENDLREVRVTSVHLCFAHQ